jgi:phosphomannomutase
LKQLEEKYEKQGAGILKIDGLTCRFNDWWFNLRPSETEPVVRLNLEAGSLELMKEKKEELSSLVNELTN